MSDLLYRSVGAPMWGGEEEGDEPEDYRSLDDLVANEPGYEREWGEPEPYLRGVLVGDPEAGESWIGGALIGPDGAAPWPLQWPLPRLPGSRGAPMGRSDGIPDDGEALTLWKVPFVDECYDVGGAYWGAPDDLYVAFGTEESGARVFVRAESWAEARGMVEEAWPETTVANLPQDDG